MVKQVVDSPSPPFSLTIPIAGRCCSKTFLLRSAGWSSAELSQTRETAWSRGSVLAWVEQGSSSPRPAPLPLGSCPPELQWQTLSPGTQSHKALLLQQAARSQVYTPSPGAGGMSNVPTPSTAPRAVLWPVPPHTPLKRIFPFGAKALVSLHPQPLLC